MKKRNMLISAILTLGVFAVGAQNVSASEDGNKVPILKNISVVQAGTKVNVNIEAQDDGELKDEASVCYVANLDGKSIEKEVSLKLVNGKYTADFNIEEAYKTAKWKVSFVTLEDKENNVAVVYNSNIHGKIAGVEKDLSTGDVNAISQEASEIKFDGITVSSNEVKLNDEVTIEVKATSKLALANEANLCYVATIDNKEVEKEVTLNLKDGKYVGKLDIDKSFGTATWKVKFITIEDTEKNVIVVYNSDVNLVKGQSLKVADITCRYEAVNIGVHNVTVDKKKAQIGETVKVTVEPIGVNLKEKANLLYEVKTSDGIFEKEQELTLVNGKYEGIVNVDKNFKNGTYQVKFITIEDKDDNVAIVYNSKANVGVGQDLSLGDFEVGASAVESTFKVENLTTQTEFKQGGKAEIKIKATNGKEQAQNVTLLVGVYDKNNKLIKFVKSDMMTVAKGENKELKVAIDLIQDGVTLKAFVWDSIEGMKPLFNVIKYNITK